MSSPLPVDPQLHALVAVTGAALVAVVCVGAWTVFWRGTTAALVRMRADLQRQKTLVEAAEVETRRLGELLRRLEDRVENDTRYGALATRAASTAYEMAIRMAASGATDGELVAACGVSLEEAALVRKLHGDRARSVA